MIATSLFALVGLAFGATPAGAAPCGSIDPTAAADGAYAELNQAFTGIGILNHDGAGQSDFF